MDHRHSGTNRRGLRREFSFLRQVQHPNLVAAYDLDLDPDNGAPLLAMEWIEGRGLLEAIREQPEQLPTLVAEALRALAFLHDLGNVHGNLKPGNLRVRKTPRRDARLVVLDCGLALRDPAALPYLAPELFDGGTHEATTDLYALGVVIYESVFERPPVRYDGDRVSFMEAVRSGRRARPAAPAGFPEGLNGWLEQMLAPDPAVRPASASEALTQWNVACGTEFPLETRVDPVIIEGARLAAIEAGLAAPRPEWDRLAASLSEAIARAEALGDPNTLLWAMTLEIEPTRGTRRPRLASTLAETIRVLRQPRGILASASIRKPHRRREGPS